MTSDEDTVRLRHMLEAACKAVEFARGRNRADLDTDEQLALALRKLIEILGEAAKHVSERFRATRPEVPWSQIARTRDRLIHGYYDIDYDIVWTIIRKHLPRVIAELQKIVPQDGE